MPFSIFDSIPVESPASLASSATVRSIFFRKLRTSRPMATSSLLSREVASLLLFRSCMGVFYSFANGFRMLESLSAQSEIQLPPNHLVLAKIIAGRQCVWTQEKQYFGNRDCSKQSGIASFESITNIGGETSLCSIPPQPGFGAPKCRCSRSALWNKRACP